jgi:hypothetical protein
MGLISSATAEFVKASIVSAKIPFTRFPNNEIQILSILANEIALVA